MIGIKWKGPILDPSGYGRANRTYTKALHLVGADITINPWNFDAKRPSFYEFGNLVESLKNRDIDYDFVIHHYVPNQVHGNTESKKINVGYSTWETDRIPRHWVDNINECFDIQIVPSEYNKETYKNSGVRIPIEVVPHCMDTIPFDQATPLELPEDIQSRFKFLSVFQWTARKHPLGLLKAYYSEFEPDENVVLILKTYRNNTSKEQKQMIRDDIIQLKNDMRFGHTPPIYIYGDLIPDYEMKSLYKACDCFVLPTRSEGFGLPIAEAMAANLPVVTTDYGGHKEYMKLVKESNILIPYQLTPVSGMPWIPYYDGKQHWAEPDLYELKKAMREMFTTPKEDLIQWGDLNKYAVKQELSYRTIGERFLEILEKYRRSHL